MRLNALFLCGTALVITLPDAAIAQTNDTPPTIRVMRIPASPVVAAPVLRATPMAQAEITPPPEVQTRAPADSVTLKSGPNSAMVRSLPIRRQISLAQVRAAPSIMIGTTRVNMAPTLANPRALFNVAQRIRQNPNLAEVVADDTRVYEVEQGLILRSFLTYRVQPGVCTDVRARALTSTGLSCANQLTDQTRTAAFANPRDPHFVPDPAARARAIQQARSKSALIDADLATNVAEVRASLNDPVKRAELEAGLGPEQTARLATMSDDQIKTEIVNSGETSIEQTLFVPRLDQVDPEFSRKYAIKNVYKPKAADGPLLLGGLMTTGPKLMINPGVMGAVAPKPDTVISNPIQPRVFLTGFTLGRAYEWKERIEKTIKTCLVSCKKTYYVEVFAGFNYGFGLRFPMKMDGTYTFKDGASGKSAQVQTNFVPVNGSDQQYLDTGLPSDKLFAGKELVAQVGAHAGAGYKLPFIGSDGIDIPVAVDFTEYLPGDFYQGQFTPPAPGGANNPKAEKVFYDLDLIGGRANFGIIGAQVFPAVRVELTSDQLTFKLHDYVTNADTLLTKTGQVTTLGIDGKNQSRFSIGDPKYNVAFLITPGLTARLFVDIAVWSHNWDFPVWFPQLALKLPPDGFEFSCHEGTECSRNYTYSPAGYSEKAGTESGLPTDLEDWGGKFDSEYLPECPDETCRIGVRFVRQGTIYNALHKWDANKALTISSFAAEFKSAQAEAEQIVNEGQARQTTAAAKSFATFWTVWWSKECADKLCFKNIKGIAFFAQWEALAQQKLHPDMSTNQVIGLVGPKFAPKFQFEVDASKARVAAEQAAAAKRAALIKPAGMQFNGLRAVPMTPKP